MKRIALVEDNPDNRLLIEAMLEGHFEVIQYEDGPSALAGLNTALPSLILLDISLPVMDGIEVLRRLKEDAELAKLPVIALTAHAMSGDRERFLSEGFDDYISKPILDVDELVSIIESLLPD